MHKTLSFEIKGLSPLLSHNGQMCDPLNSYAIQLKRVSKKRTKTVEDHEEMAHIEWFASLYLNEKGCPCMPGENIEAMLIAAAKKSKQGPQAKAGILSDGLWPILYTGPKDMEKLYKHGGFADRRPVRVQQAKVARTRPIFHDWSMVFDVSYMPDIFDERQITDLVEVAGTIIGMGDYRPKFGRFEIA